MKKLIFLIVLSLGFSIGHSPQAYSQVNRHNCVVPPYNPTTFKSFFKPLEKNELQDDFLRSVALGMGGNVDCFIQSGILKKYPFYKTSGLNMAIVFSPKLSKKFISKGGSNFDTTIATGIVTKKYPSSAATSILLAIGYNRMSNLKLLIKNGANIKEANRYIHTPLQSAIYNNRYKMAEILLKHGADPNRKHRGKSAFDIARSTKSKKFQDLLTSYGEEIIDTMKPSFF